MNTLDDIQTIPLQESGITIGVIGTSDVSLGEITTITIIGAIDIEPLEEFTEEKVENKAKKKLKARHKIKGNFRKLEHKRIYIKQNR